MKINTGKGSISLMTLIAIWSISLTVNLPGLAITPMLGNLDKIFANTTELEIQLLTVLPNLFIIPFVLLSGKLSLSKSKIRIVVIALIIYLASGILYLFAHDMVDLIVISCILGIGCGLLIPLAAGLWPIPLSASTVCANWASNRAYRTWHSLLRHSLSVG